jgi:hypothetical protein
MVVVPWALAVTVFVAALAVATTEAILSTPPMSTFW